MAVNYMDRLAALRGDRSHAAGASSHARSAPVLHADEAKKKSRKKKRKLSRKQKAALAKGRRVMKQNRSEKKMAKKKRKSPKRSSKRRRTKNTPEQRTKRLARFRKKHGVKRVRRSKRKDKSGAIAVYTVSRRRRKRSKSRKAPKRKHGRKRNKSMGKSTKRSRAGRKAARTRARNKAARSAAARKSARRRKRGGHKRGGHKRRHKRSHARRAAPRRRRRRGGRARRRTRGMMRRNNRSGKFVGKGGRSRRSHVVHYGASRKRGGYHKAGRIVREGYSMENPLDGSELAVGLVAGLIGYIAADVADRMIAGRGPLGGLPAAESAPLYSDYMRLGAGLGLTIAPLAAAHFISGAKHRNLRAAVQFLGFGAGVRTLGHLVTDLVVATLKSNSMAGPTVQALYPQEIIAAGQISGAKLAGAGALPEQIGEQMRGLGSIPEGLAACCNNSSRLLNTALSPLQPIGRSAEMGGAAANFSPVPVALPPPIERIVQQPYSPPPDYRRTVVMQQPGTPAIPAQPGLPVGVPATPARTVVVSTPGAQSMAAAYAPVMPLPQMVAGVNGLPSSPFSWGDENP